MAKCSCHLDLQSIWCVIAHIMSVMKGDKCIAGSTNKELGLSCLQCHVHLFVALLQLAYVKFCLLMSVVLHALRLAAEP